MKKYILFIGSIALLIIQSLHAKANLPPVAGQDETSTPYGTPVTFNVLANDSDPEGQLDPSSLTIMQQPTHGTASVNVATGEIEYTPNAGFYGIDSVKYKVFDLGTSPEFAFAYFIITVEPMPLNAYFTSTDITCNGLSNGIIDTIGIFGGYPPYTFQAVYQSNTFDIFEFPKDNLPAGTYEVKVIDAQNNVFSQFVTIDEPDALQVFGTWIGPVCSGTTVLVELTVEGGCRPLTFSFSNPDDIITILDDSTFTFIPIAGVNYVETVTDNKGCSHQLSLNENLGLYVESLGYISGYVLLDHNTAEPAPVNDGDTINVILIREVPNTNYQMEYLDTFQIALPNNSGHYNFDSIPPGNYRILAKYNADLPGRNLLPTYFGDKFQWNQATVIEVPVGCSIEYKEIQMLNPSLDTGTGQLSGFLYITDFIFGKTHSTDPVPLIDVVVEKDSIPGYGVYNPYQSTLANLVNGYTNVYAYAFDSLALGSYRINVLISGIPQLAYYVPIINVNGESITNLNFCVDSFALGGIDICSFDTIQGLPVGITAKESIETITAFPNPFTDELHLACPKAWKGTISLKIFSSLGQLMQTELLQANEGDSSIETSFSKGVYLLELTHEGQTFRQRLIKE